MIKEGEATPKIKGSIMLAVAESKEEVLRALQEDVYFKESIWDWNKVQIYPVYLDILQTPIPNALLMNYKFKSAFRQPL